MTGRESYQAKSLAQSLLAVTLVTCAIQAFGQRAAPATPQPAAARPFAYEVVTVKPDPTGSAFWKYTPNGFSTGGMPVTNLIHNAFWVLMDDQIVGLPGWAKSEPLAIQAKMDAETAAALDQLPPIQRWNQTLLMMQALLVDRFALKVHREKRDLPIYILTLAKGGSKMKRTAPTPAVATRTTQTATSLRILLAWTSLPRISHTSLAE